MSEGFLEGGRLGEEEEEEEEGVEPEPEAASILGPEDTLESLDENTARLLRKSWELIGGPGGGPESQARNAAPGSAYLDKLDEMTGGGRLEDSGSGIAETESVAAITGGGVKKREPGRKKRKKKSAGAKREVAAQIWPLVQLKNR